ncbi:site-2 protease family protein [Microbacterium horticulturae]|uniref:Site-2 protease family protein n=1 Tax=Microbacterium horticulturae TaxID=3028316 RepID=A0ABY8C405_9MICO|nr:site-2 protease family protein [Microbacterium sp. KACC 23027]WEG09930.1 site-2 protease family protein [Microbacterium sp. KACC 23027]
MTVLAFVIGIILMLVGLAVSIALHEMGHLLPAKKFGVRVGQYMIGFGPTIWSKRKGETEYGFKAIPLGGYISMAGMYPPSPKEAARGGRAGGGFFATMVQDARAANDETLEGDDDARTFYRLPVYKRVIVMLGGPIMNLVLAAVLFTIALSGIGVQTATTTIAQVSQCLPADTTATSCAASDPVSPATQAGFEPGDEIVSVDGTAVDTFAEASALIQKSAGESIPVVVRRGGAEQTLTLTPAARDVNGQTVGFAGITSQIAYVHQPIWSGVQMTGQNVGAVAEIIVQLPQKLYGVVHSMVTGGERDPNSPLSPVGVGVLAGEAASSSAPILDRVSFFLMLLASLNVSLFVFNLVPLLPLDGGHVVVALWDGVKRAWSKLFRRPPPKPVDATRLVPVTFVVVIALVVMGGILILADLVNPISLLGQ